VFGAPCNSMFRRLLCSKLLFHDYLEAGLTSRC
jgi:hypothetical protein